MLKSFPKIFITFFLTIFILQLASLIFLFAIPQTSQAADPATFKPQVQIPGMAEEFGATDKTGGYKIPGSTASIAKYIRLIYKYAIGIVGILAAVVLMIGGVMWIVAGGNATTIGEAKAWIGASLTGLLLALTSYLILATVNPALVNLNISRIKLVEPIAPPTTFDSTIPCGQQIPGQDRICGSKCDGNKQCEKVARETPGARECPQTLTASEQGKGDYWLCSTLSGGGGNCCDNNDDAKCPSGFICNMFAQSAECFQLGKGTCTIKQGDGGPCDEDQDCQNSFKCQTNRCKNLNPGLNQSCNNGACAPGLICAGKTFGDPGICTNGANGDLCRKDSECPNSTNKTCSASWYSLAPGTCN